MKCPKCGAAMKPLLVSMYCTADCDKKKAEPSVSEEEWFDAGPTWWTWQDTERFVQAIADMWVKQYPTVRVVKISRSPNSLEAEVVFQNSTRPMIGIVRVPDYGYPPTQAQYDALSYQIEHTVKSIA